MIQNTNYGASKTYVNTKVDKLTTSGLKAYTHDGATQGEIDVSNTYTPLTLALRDSNGRLIAADPASGATDRSLVTANWVSQTGANSPNNLLHKNGNEEARGGKQFHSIDFNGINTRTSLGVYVKLLEIPNPSYSSVYRFDMLVCARLGLSLGRFIVSIGSAGITSTSWISVSGGTNSIAIQLGAYLDDSKLIVYYTSTTNNVNACIYNLAGNTGAGYPIDTSNITRPIITPTDTTHTADVTY